MEAIGKDEFESSVMQAPVAVVDFYQASCPPCRVLEPKLDRIANHYPSVAAFRVDIDRNMEIAERLGVRSIPTVLVLERGRETRRVDSLITDADLEEVFRHANAK
jgi:thioredoxin